MIVGNTFSQKNLEKLITVKSGGNSSIDYVISAEYEVSEVLAYNHFINYVEDIKW